MNPHILVLKKSVIAVAEAVSMAGIGMVFSRTKSFDNHSRRVLSNVSMKLTIPCLLFSNMVNCPQDMSQSNPCTNLTDTLYFSWPFLILPFVWVGIGVICGFLTTRICSCPRELRGTVVAACAFGNSTGLPLVFVAAVAQTRALSHIDKEWKQQQECLLLLSIYQIMYPVLQWGFGVQLLKAPEPEFSQHDSSRSISMDSLGDAISSVPSAASSEDLSLYEKRKNKVKAFIKAAFVPPVIAVLAGVSVALFPSVRGIFVDMRDDNDNDDALFEFFLNGVTLFGGAAVPINMIILGASLASIPRFSAIHWPSTIGAVLAKLVVIPGLACGLVHVAWDPLIAGVGSHKSYVIFIAAIVAATPSANNLMVMAEVVGADTSKQALASMIFAMYCLAPLTLTLWIAVFVSMGTSDP